jgi:hypothetical protein
MWGSHAGMLAFSIIVGAAAGIDENFVGVVDGGEAIGVAAVAAGIGMV